LPEARRPAKIDRYIHPISIDLITAEGACGSYSFVLCRLLQDLKYTVRVAEMRGETDLTCHILVEVESSRGWVVLDPLYDLYFVKPDGHLASFDDVSESCLSSSAMLTFTEAREVFAVGRYFCFQWTNTL
jgi:hypothetical protein